MKNSHLRIDWRRIRRRLPALLAVGTLGIFHLVMLVNRILDQSILQRDVAGKWLLSVGLLTFAYVLHRRGLGFSLRGGQSGKVFWMLVLLLHVMLPLGGPAALDVDLNPTEPVVVLLPVTVGLAVLVAAAALLIRSREIIRVCLAPVSFWRSVSDGRYANPHVARTRHIRPPPRY